LTGLSAVFDEGLQVSAVTDELTKLAAFVMCASSEAMPMLSPDGSLTRRE
jgi:hypothetical protein